MTVQCSVCGKVYEREEDADLECQGKLQIKEEVEKSQEYHPPIFAKRIDSPIEKMLIEGLAAGTLTEDDYWACVTIGSLGISAVKKLTIGETLGSVPSMGATGSHNGYSVRVTITRES